MSSYVSLLLLVNTSKSSVKMSCLKVLFRSYKGGV